MPGDELADLLCLFGLPFEFRSDVDQSAQRNESVGVVQAETRRSRRTLDVGSGSFENRLGQIVELIRAVP